MNKKMLRGVLTACLLLACSIGFAQSPGPERNWSDLSKGSSLVCVCVVEGGFLVIRSDKDVSISKPLPNGNVIVELQNPNEYVLGRLFRVRLRDILRANVTAQRGSAIDVFIPGLFPKEGQPVLSEKQTYVLFLSVLNRRQLDEFKQAVVDRPKGSNRRTSFPRLAYQVVSSAAVIPLDGLSSGQLDEIRRTLRPRKE